YLTLSRYGDITLRSFAYVSEPQTDAWKWRWQALCVLLIASLLLPGLAWASLRLRTLEYD
ncbi:MAG: hypothetical protein RID07_04945, partial [Lacipirellulaceae bacterium]